MIREIKKDMSVIAMEILMRVISRKVKLMVKEYIIGLMEKYMMANGVKELKMVMECGKESLVIAIWVNGSILKLMDMEYISGKMEIGLRVAGTNV